MGQKMENWMNALQERAEVDNERANIWKCGMRWAVETMRKERGGEQEQRRQGEQVQTTGQEQGKHGKHVCLGEEEQFEETRAESTAEPEVTGRLAEMITGRGTAGLARGGDGGKDELEGKGREFGRKGKQHETRTRKDEYNGEGHELGRMASNMGAGGSHTQAMSDPEKEEENPKDEMGRL